MSDRPALSGPELVEHARIARVANPPLRQETPHLHSDGRIKFRVVLSMARKERRLHREMMAQPDKFPGYIASHNRYSRHFIVAGFVGPVRQFIEEQRAFWSIHNRFEPIDIDPREYADAFTSAGRAA